MNFISYKYNLDFNKLSKDLEEFLEEEKDNLFMTTIDDDYRSFMDIHDDKLEEEYNKLYEFQTNTRGIKVRGVYASQEEAELRCKLLRNEDPNHDVYVGPVGMWMPFHPEAYKTGRVEYLEKDLNELMSQKKKNDDTSKEQFKQRVKDSKKKAIQENIAKAKKEGNKLMQTIDEDGNLINANRMDVPGKNLLFGDGEDDDVSTADLRKELFDGENVIIGTQKDNDHGLSEILDRQKQRKEKQKQEQEQEQEQEQDLTLENNKENTLKTNTSTRDEIIYDNVEIDNLANNDDDIQFYDVKEDPYEKRLSALADAMPYSSSSSSSSKQKQI